MNNPKHKYRIVGSCHEVYVTYDDFQSAKQFMANASKRCGWLKIEPNERSKK